MRQDARRHLVAIAALLVGIGLAAGARLARPERASYTVDFSAVPMRIAGMHGRQLPEDPEVAEYLEADRMRTIAYGEGDEQVTASLIYGSTWRTVHTPAQCYPASGWSVVWEEDTMISTREPLPHPPPLMGRVMRVEREAEAQMVLFVFAHKGGTSIDYAEHSWAVATGPPGAGGLSLMISTPLAPGDTEEAARERLAAVAAELYPHAVAFWYQGSSAS